MGAEQFVGAWRLVSFETQRSNGEVVQPMGPRPSGQIIWSESGQFSAQLMPTDYGSGSSTDVGYVAYYGHYEVAESRGVMIHHVEGSLTTTLSGAQERWYTLNGDRLELRPPQQERDGVTSTSVLTWERCR